MGTKEAEAVVGSNQSNSPRSFTNPSCFWLLSTLSDLDKRMKMVALNIPEEDNNDTFGQRAETYYQKRPQLLALLQDLYNAYLSLADRYHQTVTKHNHHRHCSQHSSHDHYYDYDHEEIDIGSVIHQVDSDAESSLSYQHQSQSQSQSLFQSQSQPQTHDQVVDPQCDSLVVELVMKSIECDILVDEVVEQKYWSESWRKIELQKSLLEVLESERLILLDENARLGYRVATLVEENKGLGAESMFMKRKACELARCVLKMREDHGVCMLSRKIEDLQRQIYGLEKKNKEYHELLLLNRDKQMMSQQEEADHREEKKKYYFNIKKMKSRNMMLEDCFQVDQEAATNVMKEGGGSGRRVSKWWDRVKNFDMFLCVPQPNFTCC